MDYSIPIGRNYKTIDALLMAAGEAYRNACLAGSPTFAKQNVGNVERSEAKQNVGNVERSEAKQIVGNVERSEAKQIVGNVERSEAKHSVGNVEHIEARRGSGNAHRSDIEALLDQHGDRVLRLAYSYRHNMSDAEDILQETMIRYFEKAPEEMSEEHKKSWLLRVAANLA
ncbi:MAG: sigma factor, partial [Lachnospiraceae bacterium]|nr:sigma factor [Lachnospiraceae bacterium]